MEVFLESLFVILALASMSVIPLAVIVLFIIFLVRFLKTPKEQAELRSKRKRSFKICSAILGIIAAGCIAVVLIFMQELSHM